MIKKFRCIKLILILSFLGYLYGCAPIDDGISNGGYLKNDIKQINLTYGNKYIILGDFGDNIILDFENNKVITTIFGNIRHEPIFLSEKSFDLTQYKNNFSEMIVMLNIDKNEYNRENCVVHDASPGEVFIKTESREIFIEQDYCRENSINNKIFNKISDLYYSIREEIIKIDDTKARNAYINECSNITFDSCNTDSDCVWQFNYVNFKYKECKLKTRAKIINRKYKQCYTSKYFNYTDTDECEKDKKILDRVEFFNDEDLSCVNNKCTLKMS